MSMEITASQSRVCKIVPGDREFYLREGLVLYPRAFIEFDPACPDSIRQQIVYAAEQGYIRPASYMLDYEATAQLLGE